MPLEALDELVELPDGFLELWLADQVRAARVGCVPERPALLAGELGQLGETRDVDQDAAGPVQGGRVVGVGR